MGRLRSPYDPSLINMYANSRTNFHTCYHTVCIRYAAGEPSEGGEDEGGGVEVGEGVEGAGSAYSSLLPPLVVNMQGWVKGMGYELTVDILKAVGPTHLLQVQFVCACVRNERECCV